MDRSPWFEKTYPELSGYGLWLRGGELNTLPPAQFDARPLRVLITRLSTSRDVADSFTHKLLYQILSRIDGVFPDLAYLPPPKDAAVFDRDCVPWLLGTSTKRGGGDFSVIAFSLSIVQELLNIAPMLKNSAIPVGKKERMADASAPLVILGGASALYTSSLFCDNPLVDGVFIGADAGCIQWLFETCREGAARGCTKRETLSSLRAIPGFFEPDGNPVATVFQNPRLPPQQLLEAGPIAYDGEIGGGALQLSEGCGCFCGFCAEGFSHKPYREFDMQTLLNAARHMKANMAVSDIELYSFNFAGYRDFYALVWELSAMFPSIGLKSQRMDSIALDPDMLGILHAVGKSSMTCAIEGISPRLRRYLHKSLDESALERGLAHLLSAPLRELKIFLIATGLEEEEDYREFQKLLDQAQTMLRGAQRRPRIIFSMTILVRFPWTPLEFEDAPEPKKCDGVVRRVERAVHQASFEFRAAAGAWEYWVSQALVRAANPAVGKALRAAAEETGFIYYIGVSPAFVVSAKRNMDKSGIPADAALKAIPPSQRETAPWNCLDIGVDQEFLRKLWEEARTFEDNGYCAGAGVKKGACLGCKACTDDQVREALLLPPKPRGYSAQRFKDRLREIASREAPMCFKVIVGSPFRGVPSALRAAALARSMMLADIRLVQAYRRFASHKPDSGILSDWLIGDDVITLYFNDSRAALVNELARDPVFIKKVNDGLEGRETLIGPFGRPEAAYHSILMKSPFPFDPAGFCKSKALKFTVQRKSAETLRYVFSKDSLKKKIVLDCSSENQAGGGVVVTIEPGPKFHTEEFARSAFAIPKQTDWVEITMMARLLP